VKIRARNARRKTAANMKDTRKAPGYTWTDYSINTEMSK